MVITEGPVMYLNDDTVTGLARALRHPSVTGWCLDFSAAGVAALIADRNRGLLRHAPWTFLPANGLAFFEDLGWHAHHVESILTAAARFGRLGSPQMRAAAAGPQPDPRAPGHWPYSAVAYLIRPVEEVRPGGGCSPRWRPGWYS